MIKKAKSTCYLFTREFPYEIYRKENETMKMIELLIGEGMLKLHGQSYHIECLYYPSGESIVINSVYEDSFYENIYYESHNRNQEITRIISEESILEVVREFKRILSLATI